MGVHLLPGAGQLFGGLAVAGGFCMGIAYLFVLAVTLVQRWGRLQGDSDGYA